MIQCSNSSQLPTPCTAFVIGVAVGKHDEKFHLRLASYLHSVTMLLHVDKMEFNPTWHNPLNVAVLVQSVARI